MTDLLQYLSDCQFILVSNREPYEHVRGDQGNIMSPQPTVPKQLAAR